MHFIKFLIKAARILNFHGIPFPDDFQFSEHAAKQSSIGDWLPATTEWRDFIATALSGRLHESHAFLDKPYTRKFDLNTGHILHAAIINKQGDEWYGQQHSQHSFDFQGEFLNGRMEDCTKFLDLGGHQMLWATFYAKTKKTARVVSVEPSVLNCLIGLFNCLINSVLDQVTILPVAVSSSVDFRAARGKSSMLVDFMTSESTLTTCFSLGEGFDFIKCDIEGYEYNLISDQWFIEICRSAKCTHFELHLGHLKPKGIGPAEVLRALEVAKVLGVHSTSGQSIREFLSKNPDDGFYSFDLRPL